MIFYHVANINGNDNLFVKFVFLCVGYDITLIFLNLVLLMKYLDKNVQNAYFVIKLILSCTRTI